MIVKCDKGIVFEIADVSGTVTCPKECPERRFCKNKFFIPKQATGKPVLTIQDVDNKPKESEVKTPVIEEVKVEETPSSFVSDDDPFAMFMEGQEEVNQPDEFSELEDSKKVIIYIGSKDYYAPRYATKMGFPNIEMALYEIFKHWNTDVVFENKNKFTPEFLNVLKIKYRERYKDIVRELELKNGSVNSNFYWLFYKYIYFGSQITNKFYFAVEFQFNEIKPIITNIDDLVDTLYARSNFMSNFCGCEKELLEYLNIDTMSSLHNRLVKLICEKYSSVTYFKTKTDSMGRTFKSLVSLSQSLNSFVSNLYVIEMDRNKMEEKIEFLKTFDILDNKYLETRRSSLVLSDIVGNVDDGIYDLLEISNYNSGQAKDVLKLFLVLLKEYIRIANPSEIIIGNIKISKANFYNEIKEVIHNSYKKLALTNVVCEDIKKLYLLLVLKNNGILDYFNKHTTTKIDDILPLIKEKINYNDYLNSEIENKVIFYEGKTLTLNNYFGELIDYNDIYQLNDIISNDAIFKVLEKNIQTDLSVVIKYLDTTMKKV